MGYDGDPLSEEEIERVREIIAADKSAKMAWAMFRRAMGWVAATLAAIYILWKMGLDVINIRTH